MLPLKPYTIHQLRKIASHGSVMWDIFSEGQKELEEMHMQCINSSILKMELKEFYNISKPEHIDDVVRKAIIFGDHCLGPIIMEILFARNPDTLIAALARYVTSQRILGDDKYLEGYNFRLSVLCEVLRVMIQQTNKPNNQAALESFLDILPLTYAQHKGAIQFFENHVPEIRLRLVS